MNTLLAMNFNKTEFLKLLKNKRKIKGKKKSKYYKYRAFIGVQFYCQYGERFLIILENYVNKKIELDILLDDFSEYKKMITKITDEFLEQVVEKPTLLDSFQISSNAKEFYRQVENIEALDEDLFDNLCLDNPPYDFDTVVKKTYYTMKRLMEESKSTFLPTDEQIVNDSVLVSEEKFDNQVIPRLIWLSSVMSLGLILIGRFLT